MSVRKKERMENKNIKKILCIIKRTFKRHIIFREKELNLVAPS